MGTSRGHEHGMTRAGYILLLLLLAVGTLVLLSVLDRVTRKESAAPPVGVEGTPPQAPARATGLDETHVDPALWGKTFPHQYDTFQRTVDMSRTRHGGSEAFQKLDADPLWRELFAGYAFGIDYREERGHAYMLQDQRESERVTRVKQPGGCLHCHASIVSTYRELGRAGGAPGEATDALGSVSGRAQLMTGFEALCAMPYTEAVTHVTHPVACIDCHDPTTLRLRVTRPAFMEGIAALAEGDAAVRFLPSVERWRKSERGAPYDANALASRDEMRVLVCAQCHAEYTFVGPGNRVIYPWNDGLGATAIEAYYDASDVTDWTHGVSRAPMLKAQHPEFEMWAQGIHGRSGVACADCHMPSIQRGSTTFSDHQVRSPMFSIHAACQACHDEDESTIQERVREIQDRTQELMLRAERATVSLIETIREGMAAGLDDADLVQARDLHRRAQWRLDFVASENSMGFHAPQEAARLLGEAIDYARQGEIAALEAEKAVSED